MKLWTGLQNGWASETFWGQNMVPLKRTVFFSKRSGKWEMTANKPKCVSEVLQKVKDGLLSSTGAWSGY